MKKLRHIIDLTHRLETGMPTYPGDRPKPQIIIRDMGQYVVSEIYIGAHYGTHIDAPRHFLKEGQTIADFKVDRFSGSALCIVRQLHHVSALDLTDAEILRIKDLKPEFLLIRTGFDQNWGKPVYFQAHPYLSLELARQLIALNVSGIGMDFPSADAADGDAQNYPVHHLLMKHEILIIENLTNLDNLPHDVFTLFALPLKIQAEGAPARVVALF
jgi:kynurenine formamidase